MMTIYRLYIAYQNAFAFPSLYEGFGLPVLEAMACHTPVITSNNSSLIEVAGDATLLINPTSTQEIANALNQILDNKDLRQTLISKGILQAQKFHWYDSALQLHQIYGNSLGEFLIKIGVSNGTF